MRPGRIADGAASGWLVFWFGLCALYIHLGGLAFAGLAVLLGLAGWAVWAARAREWPLADRDGLRAGAAFGLFFAWLALSSLWGGQGADAAFRLGAQLLLSASIAVLILSRPEQVRRRLSRILMVTAPLGALILLLDVATGYGIHFAVDPVAPGDDRVSRLSDAEMNIGRAHVSWTVLAPLVLALLATRLGGRRAALVSVAFVALIVAGTWMNGLSIVPIVLALSLPVAWLALKAPRLGLNLSVGGLAATILFAPVIGIAARLMGEAARSRLPMSWDHRVRMWDYGWARIQDAPLIGHGLDSSRVMNDEFTTRIGVDWPIVSLHPHNVGLQTWMEAGAVGAVLLTLAVLSLRPLLRRLCDASPWRAFAVAGTVAAITLSNLVTVGAWQYWWWGLAATALCGALLVPKRS